MKNNVEKRACPRMPLNCDIGFEITLFEEKGQIRTIKTRGYGLDISSNGIGMLSPCAFSKGEVIRVILPKSIMKSESPVFAEVLWSKVEGETCRAGLRFLINNKTIRGN